MKQSKLRSIISEEVRQQIFETSVHLPKGKWVKASKKSLAAYKQELFDMIKSSYAQIGGHHKFKSPVDISTSVADFWEFIDIDGDDEPEAMGAAKTTQYGRKSIVGASDGTSPAKRAFIGHRIKSLRHNGFYAEVSEKIADILLGAGVPIVDNEEDVRKVLGKDIKWIGEIPGKKGNGWYSRKLAGQTKAKILVGRPKV